jgi:hypothetical protein
MAVTYGCSKISSTVIRWMQYFQNALAYSAMDVSYARKMLMKLSPGVRGIKLFTAAIYDCFK